MSSQSSKTINSDSNSDNSHAEIRGGNLALKAVENQKVDISSLISEIRERVKADVEKYKDKQPNFIAKKADADARSSYKAGDLLRSQDLAYLNKNYQYSFRSRGPAFTSTRGGIIGKIIVKIKSKFIVFREFILRDYIESEKEFQAHLVRHLNEINKYIDTRDSACFWELINKIDYDITKAFERIDRIHDEQTAIVRSSERSVHDELDRALKDIRKSVEELRTGREQQGVKINELDSVAHGLESLVANLNKRPVQPLVESQIQVAEAKSDSSPDYSYLLLENRFRGSEEEISKRQEFYLPYFPASAKPVIEVGGGRGELQQLFRKNNITSYSVDIDSAMVEANRARGLDVREGDGIAHLASLPDRSVGGVIAIQVVEHLTKSQLENLMRVCSQKVIPGGKIIFETINPQSVLALSSNYFRDLTHVFPLHPDTLSYVMELSGLKVLEVKYLSPVPEQAKLKAVTVEDYMTPRWAYTVQVLNHNITQLNSLLYGYQDYCIVAEVRA